MANLTQLRMLESLSGILPVDKPQGLAFASVVKAVKRKFNLVKVGHGGSLDALASGLFVVLIGDANRFAGDLMGADRAYSGTMRLGLRTTTHDVQGEVLAETPAAVDAARLAAVAADFRGDLFQTEPRFCSIRKEGSPAYEIADTGDHERFLTHVYRFTPAPGEGSRATFEVVGTKSLLVRTLVNDFGAALGCGAALETLRRTRVGRLTVEEAVPFERLLETEAGDLSSLVLPPAGVLHR